MPTHTTSVVELPLRPPQDHESKINGDQPELPASKSEVKKHKKIAKPQNISRDGNQDQLIETDVSTSLCEPLLK